jgi:hypothetical protein
MERLSKKAVLPQYLIRRTEEDHANLNRKNPSSDSNSDPSDCNSKALPHFPTFSVEKDGVVCYLNLLTCVSNHHSAQLQSKQ